ncbi:RNA polymerase II transcriptional coactivator KELP [Nymphaea colorata]|uniref:RNA polymerase II transcriptional coactivator KELP n=1 Tax=Nymphaea colorata TaxID=210225 RepID=UPI00129E89CD|nr:RNA polymerase II transcriptional coactivator KELP [Nymphaea colorata]
MDAETKRRVEKMVVGILEKADMTEMTEFKVRSLASERLGIDLSGSREVKKFVRGIVENFLESRAAQAEGGGTAGDEEEVEEQRGDRKRGRAAHDDDEEEEEQEDSSGDEDVDENGDPILCRLSSKRRVTLQEFRGKTLVSIREYYLKDGKELPSSKGISLTTEQWVAFKKAVPAIEKAIREIQSG